MAGSLRAQSAWNLSAPSGGALKLGFGLQFVTVRWTGAFLEDPADVPAVVLDFVAGQLGVADPSCVKKYTERTA